MHLRTIAICLSALLAAVAAHAADSPPEAVADTVQQCNDCHGDKGHSSNEKFPSIGGMSAFYVDEQLRAWRRDERPCEEYAYPSGDHEGEKTDMCQQVEGMSDDEIAQIAEYYAAQEWKPIAQPYDPAMAEKGKKIHELNCEKCHSKGGSLAFDDAGILAGQWRHYLEETFEEYAADERWQPEKMKPKMDELSDADTQALIEYYVSQGGGEPKE